MEKCKYLMDNTNLTAAITTIITSTFHLHDKFHFTHNMSASTALRIIKMFNQTLKIHACNHHLINCIDINAE